MTTPFVGRKAQLETLRSAIGHPSHACITAIYGRRRIGKTRLVFEAYPDIQILHFEGLEGVGSADQKKHFIKTLWRHSGLSAHRLVSAVDWEDLLILLAEYVAGKRCVIFFDEFQWMAAGRNELVSKLKYVWDNWFKVADSVHLILCGSISSFLVHKVIRSKALYGRIDHIIELGPLAFGEARAGFFSKRSLREALEYYLVMGGVPKYLELYDPSRSVRLNLAEKAFRPNAYFLHEFERLFTSHFGEVAHYRHLVAYLARRGFASREALAAHVGLKPGGRLSTLLENLCLAGFVERYTSVHSPGSTRLMRYRLTDPYLWFYFRFIRPVSPRIQQSRDGLPLHLGLPDKRYDVFLGHAFERFCIQHASVIAHRLGFGAIAYDFGAWFVRSDLASDAQIDLLFKRADHVITLCEVKHRKRVGREVISEVEKKVEALRAKSDDSIEKVLISAFPPARELYDEGYFSRILTAEDFQSD